VTLDHPIFTRWPAQYPDRLQLFSAPTPNGVKVANASDRSLASSACACSSSSIGSLLSIRALPTYSRYFSIALSRSRALKLVRVTPSDNLVHERAIGVQVGEVARRRHRSLALRQDREALGDGVGPKSNVEEGAVVKLGERFFVIAVSTGKFVCDGNEIMGISTQAPIYAELEGKRTGDAISFNGTGL